MGQCPQCGGIAETDPEHSGVLWCLSCWLVWTLPCQRTCSGRRPTLIPALRRLDEDRNLRR